MIKELIERVKLTPIEKDTALQQKAEELQKAGEVFPKGQAGYIRLLEIRVDAEREAQLNKVLNDPDLCLLTKISGTHRCGDKGQYLMQAVVIPTREAIKEGME